MTIIREGEFTTVQELLEAYEEANDMVLCFTAATPPGVMWYCPRLACSNYEWTPTVLAHPLCPIHGDMMTIGVWRPLIMLIHHPSASLPQP